MNYQKNKLPSTTVSLISLIIIIILVVINTFEGYCKTREENEKAARNILCEELSETYLLKLELKNH